MSAVSRRPAAWIAGLGTCLVAVGLSLAQIAPTSLLPEDQEAELSALRRKIQEHRERSMALQADEKSQLQRLSELEKEAALTQQLLATLSSRSGEILEETTQLEEEIAQVQARVSARREHLAARLRSMYMRGERSPLLVLITSSSVDNMTARMRTLTHLARAEKRLITNVLADQRRLRRQQSELHRRLSEVHRTQSEVEDQKLQLERLRQERTGALASLRDERAQFEASLHELEQSAQALERLIEGLHKDTPSPSGGPSMFATAKGALPWPVQGEILRPFGRVQHPEFKTIVVNKGINIAASIGTPIQVVADGNVEYVDWLPGYGKCIIVDHGDGYFTLYAHASKIFPATGARVARGEVIGEAGDTGSLNGSQLYFEVRMGREPVNPLEWLSRR